MRDPGTVERHWLTMAVATVSMLSVGSQSDEDPPQSLFEQLPIGLIAQQRSGQLLPQSWPSTGNFVSNTS